MSRCDDTTRALQERIETLEYRRGELKAMLADKEEAHRFTVQEAARWRERCAEAIRQRDEARDALDIIKADARIGDLMEEVNSLTQLADDLIDDARSLTQLADDLIDDARSLMAAAGESHVRGLMLRALGESWDYHLTTDGLRWAWYRDGFHDGPTRYYAPATQAQTPEGTDELYTAMRASLGEDH